MSESSALFQALLDFQKDVPALKRDSVNPHFGNKFVSLDQVTKTITPLLCEHGLVWSTFPCRVEGEPSLRYRLTHPASGEKVEDVMPLMLTKNDPQGQGSSLTYARRYAISAVLGLSAEDDDGNQGSTPPGGQRTQQQQSQPPRNRPKPRLAAETLKELRETYSLTGWSTDELRMRLTAVGAPDVSDIKTAMTNLTDKQAAELRTAMNIAIDAIVAQEQESVDAAV